MLVCHIRIRKCCSRGVNTSQGAVLDPLEAPSPLSSITRITLDSKTISLKEIQSESTFLTPSLSFSPAGLRLPPPLHGLQQLHLQQPTQPGVPSQDKVPVPGEHRPDGLGYISPPPPPSLPPPFPATFCPSSPELRNPHLPTRPAASFSSAQRTAPPIQHSFLTNTRPDGTEALPLWASMLKECMRDAQWTVQNGCRSDPVDLDTPNPPPLPLPVEIHLETPNFTMQQNKKRIIYE